MIAVEIPQWRAYIRRRCRRWGAEALANLQSNHLWQRMVKSTVCTTIMLAIGLIPAVVNVYGRSTYLGAMATVFGNPGQRFGQMAESLVLILLGTFVGMGWSMLGLYLSSLVAKTNSSADFGIRAVFFTLALLLHGVLRSSTPRLFMFVFFLLLICLTTLTTTAESVSTMLATQIAYPILTAIGVVVLVNVSLWPESSSGFLGDTTIGTLCDAVDCLENATAWFCGDANAANAGKGAAAEMRSKLASLTDKKTKLRARLAVCKRVQAECNFELVYAVLSPRSLKRISTVAMNRLVANTISLVNACESKWALLGEEGDNILASEPSEKHETDEDDPDDSSSSDDGSTSDTASLPEETPAQTARASKISRKSKHRRNLEFVKPIREIESGDVQLLEQILTRVRVPVAALQEEIHQAKQLISCCLAHCYEVSKLPSGAQIPHGITLEEIDIRATTFARAMAAYDDDSAAALGKAAAMAYGDAQQVDIMPRMETFLISSFLISLRHAAGQIADMLRFTRLLVERRQKRDGRRRLYFPRISWRKWLQTGGEQDVNSVPEHARKAARAGHGSREDDSRHDDDGSASSHEQLSKQSKDVEKGLPTQPSPLMVHKGDITDSTGPRKSQGGTIPWLRGLAADFVESLAGSDDLAFALKMSVAGYLVTWPAFVPSLNHWYVSIRGTWASLQLILVFEVSVGTSFQGFFLRALGVVFGCVMGFLAFEIGSGNRIVAVVVLVFGLLPSTYVRIGTPYVKTGIISMVSMSVVGLASILTPGPERWDIFVERLSCFMIGGTVALLVELFLFPSRARDKLVESLASSIQQISNMEAAVAVGIDSPENPDIKNEALHVNFTHAKEKAEAALSAARTFLPFTLTEPRLKGSFRGQALIYGEIIYVLFQIIERMDNMLHLRETYGSSVLEQLHDKVLPYRRNVAASITITLFAVHEALTTKLPLPQFLPSSRVAQLRYISRVREVMMEQMEMTPRSSAASAIFTRDIHRPSTPLFANSNFPKDLQSPSTPISGDVLKIITKQSFLSWNAGSAGMIEIIEYLEELVDLAKLLVGVNAFRTGMLERPRFQEYIMKIKARELASTDVEKEAEKIKSEASNHLRKRHTFSFHRANSEGAKLRRRQSSGVVGGGDAAVESDEDGDVVQDLPMSLQRVRTKRLEEWETERTRRVVSANSKGKDVMRGAKTWKV